LAKYSTFFGAYYTDIAGLSNHGIWRLSIWIGNFIIPTDELHHFSAVGTPSTSYWDESNVIPDWIRSNVLDDLHFLKGGPVSKGNFILGIVGWKFNTRSKIWWISNLFGIQWVFIYTIYNIGWKAFVVHKNHHNRHAMQHAAKSMGLLPGCPSDWIIL
jgi:hypothetical protein